MILAGMGTAAWSILAVPARIDVKIQQRASCRRRGVLGDNGRSRNPVMLDEPA